MKVQPNKSSTQASVGVTCKSKKNINRLKIKEVKEVYFFLKR
tara:strand:+ start:2401 stop:2526 length:126 start_codon:yes stop_codon:yes gene_type:complete